MMTLKARVRFIFLLAVLAAQPCLVHGGPPQDFGDSLLFNGANQYVSIPNFGSIIPTNEITVEFWALRDRERAAIRFHAGPG